MRRALQATRLSDVPLSGPAGRLEAVLQHHEGAEHGVSALICHPHPLYGGTLHNKVVHRTAATLHQLGASVLRFNFRGVGGSEGRFDHGRGELEDARAALGWLRDRYPGARRWAVGFSFGSWVAARLAASEPDVERLVLIAPPVRSHDFVVLRYATCPKLVIQGLADDVCRPEDLAREYVTWSPPRELVEVPGATHFFDRQLGALSEALLQALSAPAREGTSWST